MADPPKPQTDAVAPPAPPEGTEAPRLHGQQIAAVTHRASSVGLSAGAGCGKTTVLIERFLQELDPARDAEPGPHGLPAVVAITFTEKATAEMVSRVRQGVGRRLRDPVRVDERARWRTVQRRLDTARISTIHGFCTALLKEHAAAADLDPAFRTMEGTEEADLRAEVADAALKAALAAAPETHDDPHALSPRELVTRCGLTLVRSTVLNLLDVDRDLLDRPWTVEDLAAARAAAWGRDLIEPQLAALVDSPDLAEVRPVLERNLDTQPTRRAERTAALSGLERLLTTRPDDHAALRATLGEVCPLITLPKLGRSAKQWDGDDYAVLQRHLAPVREAAKRLATELGEAPPEFGVALPVVRAYVPLAAAAAAAYEKAKRDTARLDFGDQLRLAGRLLRDEAVREKVTRSIRLLMVDEFQDTSPVQAEMVRRLAGLAAGTDQGKLFLVGDAKQSIYRFTGADPHVFSRLRDELPAAGRLPLTKNFRSRPEILRFVNALFDPAMPDYEPLEPPDDASPQTPGGPHVEFLLPVVPPDADGKKPTAEACRTVEARWIAARVRELLDGDPCVRVKDGADRVPRPGDVCLLFRALTDVKLYEDALREVGIDCYLAGGKSFFAQQEVQDLVHLLLWLDDPDDTLSLAGVLRSPLCGLSDDTLFLLAESPPHADGSAVAAAPLTAAILDDRPFALPDDQAERFDHARRTLRDLLACRTRLGPGGLLERAVHRTGYDGSVLLEFLGERKLANLRKLLRMARDADAAPDGALRGFAARLLDSVKETLNEDEAATVSKDPNVVTLMTVHGSKGLEFPIVVACDLDRQPPSVSVSGVFDPDLGPIVPLTHQHGEKLTDPGAEIWKAREKLAEEAEAVRVFYVAATRAADRLILSAARPSSVEKKSGKIVVAAPTGVPLKTLDAAFDLTAGTPRTDPPDARPLFVPPAIRTHDAKPAGTGKALPATRRGTPPEKFAEVLASAEPCEPYDLRRPLPPVRPRVVSVSDLADTLAGDAAREELAAFEDGLLGATTVAEPDGGEIADAGPLAAAWRRLPAELNLPDGVEQRRALDYLIPSPAADLPALTGRAERLYRLGGVAGAGAGWLAAGVAPATAAEAGGDGVPDRFVPRLWAEREALRPLGGGHAALLLVAADGTTRVVRTDRLPDPTVLHTLPTLLREAIR